MECEGKLTANSPFPGSSLADCIEGCETTPSCVSVTYNRGFCILRSTYGLCYVCDGAEFASCNNASSGPSASSPTSSFPTASTFVTSTSSIAQSATPSCRSPGLVYNVFDNPYEVPAEDKSYPNFSPSHFNNGALPTLYNGTSEDINFVIPADGRAAIYAVPFQSENQRAIVLQGYFAPEASGTHTITLSGCDDIAYIWLGDAAFNTWEDSNYNCRATQAGDDSLVEDFTAGTFYPITILYANSIYNGRLQLSITTPDGISHNDTTGFFEQPICRPGNFTHWTSVNATIGGVERRSPSNNRPFHFRQ